MEKHRPTGIARVDEKAVSELVTTGTCTPFEKEYIRKEAVELRREADRLWLSMRDDGTRFDPTVGTQHSSLGLVTMKERALLVRGGLEVRSAPRQGTEIRAWFPLASPEPRSTTKSA